MPAKTITDEDQPTPLRLLGYRFVHRLDGTHIILASLPNEDNYMLFREVDTPSRYCVSLRNRWFQFETPIARSTNRDLYFIAAQNDKDRANL